MPPPVTGFAHEHDPSEFAQVFPETGLDPGSDR